MVQCWYSLTMRTDRLVGTLQVSHSGGAMLVRSPQTRRWPSSRRTCRGWEFLSLGSSIPEYLDALERALALKLVVQASYNPRRVAIPHFPNQCGLLR